MTKVCRDCGRELPAENFWKHGTTKDGLQSYCKECCYKRRQTHPSHRREAHLAYQRKHRYGVSADDLAALVVACGNKCVICGGEWTDVDHDHETGRVRGLLCRKCNLALGHLDDDPERVRRAAEYLEAA